MAQFKTAYLQAAFASDVGVIGTVNEGTEVTATNRKAALCRNDFVVYTPATATIPAYITKATQAQVTAKTATHIVALTDQTEGGGYVHTDLRDYKPSELVGATAASAAAGMRTKKVMLYPIFNWNDIVQDADANDVTGA